MEDTRELFRPSGALLQAETALGRAIEEFAVGPTSHSPTTLDLLVRLHFAPNHQLRGVDLVNQMFKSPGYVSRVIDAAEEEGLVERLADPDDRRAQLITLTRGGEEALEEFIPLVSEVLNKTIYAYMSPKEIETLITLLGKVTKAAHKVLGS